MLRGTYLFPFSRYLIRDPNVNGIIFNPSFLFTEEDFDLASNMLETETMNRASAKSF